MIDARELRIGNWVMMAHENVPEVVNIKVLQFISHSNAIGKKHPFEPIPLNPEILEKCGFKSVHGFTYLNHEKLNLASFQYDEVKNCIWLEFEGTICGIEIYYLHQLQNLYYSLTNSELNITL